MATANPAVGMSPPATRTKQLARVRWVLVAVYAWSAGGKIFWPDALRGILQNTGMIPREYLSPLVYGLPAAELVLAVALAIRLLLPLALLLSTFLATAFAGIHGFLLISGDMVPCGCCGVAIDYSGTAWHAVLFGVSVAMVLTSAVLLFTLPARQRGG